MGNKRHTVVVMEELSRPKLTSNNVSMFKPGAVSLPKFRIGEIWDGYDRLLLECSWK